ncbi:MAG: hypothetical protein COU35_03050 [Candidatus Magasanikbacteria bacterium CG10_big_fil_rev_8_21_14_0_10_47_10]|uniref:Uncharacterized protein n=1 Tax=Candidatus Magasanikbacteria bacterium CG10_big_fil_rev_8_21_14_0_10_47_10 TaxID=1974652 RepID=A0A2H0TRU6_9BACT|nr:MAG: hypothetical protein COU35_03050 [Candidatus Magasanikbacteria bacterium CG10_big_fil_rev_8_21_14_0_10_47_10]
MSKLGNILAELDQDTRVHTLGTSRDDHRTDYGDTYWWEYVYVHVAPAKPLYDALSLQNLFSKLLPAWRRSSVLNIVEDEHGGLTVGNLVFDEQIGMQHVTRHVTLAVNDALPLIPNGSLLTDDQPIMRQICVRLYPAVLIAAEGYARGNMHMVTREQLLRCARTMDTLQ